MLKAEALRRESLTGSEAVLDASHEEYVRREELVAAIRQELAETESQLAALLARRSELNELLARNV